MHRNTRSTLQRQRGFTLMEILVAVAIFATVMIVALLLYDRSNRVFKTTNEAAEMQQNTRVAYEKVVADLRMAGFDYKRAGTPSTGIPAPWVAGRTYSAGALVTPTTPNGHVYRAIVPGTSANPEPGWTKGSGDVINDNAPLQWQESGAPVYEQPDEQIEFAHSNAITLRANFDYGDVSTPDKGRETDLENSTGGRFPMVTTGNDEIVTYALVSRSGHADANKDSITFYADVNPENTAPSRRSYPGGSPERLITIPNVDLTNKYPPYTLMRYTIGKDGKVVETALADNIRSLTFQYWEDAQATRPLTDLLNAPVTNIGGGGMYDPAKPNEKIDARIIRGKIRAMTASIVGMNPQPDPNYTNATDTVAPKYRQYALQSTVVGRNLGLEGIPQSTSNPPGPPTVTAVCTGYCGVAYLTWKPAEGTTDTTYTVLYDTSSAGSFSGVLPAGSQTSYAVDLTQLIGSGTTFYFRVAATNSNGTTLSTNFVTAEVKNATKPNAPTDGVASGGAVTGAPAATANQIDVSWKAPIGNASGTVSCSAPTPTAPDVVSGEIKGFRLYRSRTAGFDLTTAGVEQLFNEETGGATTDGSGLWRFVDTNVGNCEKYYYRVQAVEWCAASAATNTTNNTATAISDLSTEIAGEAISTVKPKQVQNLKVHPDSICDADTGKCYPIRLTWDKVLQDVSNKNVLVRNYDIYRQRKKGGSYDEPTKTLAGSVADGSTTWSEPASLAYSDTLGVKYSYEYTVHATYCGLDGIDAVVVFPDECSTGATITPNMLGPGSGTVYDPWQNVDSLQVGAYATKPLIGVEYRVDGVGGFSPLSLPYVLPWTDSGDGETHTVEFRFKTADCTELETVYIQDDAPSCELTGTVVSTAGTTTRLDINLVSTSSEIITIDSIDVQWAGQTGFAWNSITMPSGAVTSAAGTPANARTATFTPTAAADRKIAAGGAHKLVMNFSSAGGTALGSSVAAVRVKYTIPSTNTVVHDCAVPLGRCAVTGSGVTASTSTFSVPIANPSDEQLSVKAFTITWTGQNKWGWGSVTLPNGTVVNVTTAAAGGTQTFTLATPQTVDASGDFNLVMNMVETGNNPQALAPANVTSVLLNYTTPASGTVVMTCRVK
ncbi:MAG TPA: prepilin-type N-terminal cleavage/methylation domain-containing protein [Thermoanaerobaculia bacterium]